MQNMFSQLRKYKINMKEKWMVAVVTYFHMPSWKFTHTHTHTHTVNREKME